MTWKHYLGITILSAIVMVSFASFQSTPGYMDAEYYYSMGLRIANNQGLSEPFIWNYLNDVQAIPHPGFTYWMPMPAFLTALGIWITGVHSFLGGRLFHILLSVLMPALTIKITWEITGDKTAATLAGFLAIFPVFYGPFLGTTDSFALVMMLGGIFYLLNRRKGNFANFISLGVIAGMMHLSRADGLLWIIYGFYCAIKSPRKRLVAMGGVLGGYLIGMTPWFVRNLIEIGRVMPSGLASTLWFRDYNELFTFSTVDLTYQNWISQGFPTILSNYLKSGLTNLRTAAFVESQIILAPLVMIGAWKHRRDIGVQAAFLVWLSIFFVMSIVFPFAGLRGGFFHSSAALQTMIWALAASGFMQAIEWGVQKRDWVRSKASLIFGSMLVVMIALAALFVYSERVIGGNVKQPIWDVSFKEAEEIADNLDDLGLGMNDLVLINNPPGFYAASGRSSIVIPDGSVESVIQAADKYGAEMLILEANHPPQLDGLYNAPYEFDQLLWISTVNGAHFFQIKDVTP